MTIAKNRSLPPEASWSKEINKTYKIDKSFENEIKYYLNAIKNNLDIKKGNSYEALKVMTLIDKIYKSK